jgi:hypothetical protein
MASRAGAAVVVLAVATLATVLDSGCGPQPSSRSQGPKPTAAQRTTLASTKAATIVCGASEWYIPDAINSKLKQYPDFAQTIGMRSVTDCAGARAYTIGYAKYSQAHPNFDFHQVIDRLPTLSHPPNPLNVEPLQVQKVLNGFPLQVAPVVRISNLGFPVTCLTGPNAGQKKCAAGCTGTFIAKNWIVTAGHCLGPDDQGVLPTGAFDSTGLPQTNPDAGFPANLVLDDWVRWRIRWADANGNGIPSDAGVAGQNVAAQMDVWAFQIVDPRWVGYSNVMIGDQSDAWDFGLLYIPSDYDVSLPASPDNGSAMRISIIPPGGNTTPDYLGFGEPNVDLEFGSYSGSYSVESQLLVATVPDTPVDSVTGLFTAPTVCHGDSGGPALIAVHTGTSGTLQPAIVGTLDNFIAGPLAFNQNSTGQCADIPKETVNFAKMDQSYPLIALMMGAVHPGFSCNQFFSTGGSTEAYAQCWGTPCTSDSDCNAPSTVPGVHAAPTAYCDHPASYFSTSTCSTCTSGQCDCIVGECMPLQQPTLVGAVCAADSDCGFDAPVCVFTDDGGSGTCQAGGEDGGND